MGGTGGTRRRSPPASGASRAHLWAALLLGLLVFAYLWPVLVGGRILSPIADLYGSVPWRSYAPADVQRYQNTALIDLPLVLHPWRLLARELIHEGVLPAWNPYALAGVPFYANPQTGLFSLFNVPLWILPLTYGLGVSAALKLVVGAFGTYLLARRLRLGFLSGLLAGVAFAFCAVNVVWLTHAELPGVLALLPWALLFVERILADGRLANALGLALATAVALGGGHPGMQVHFLAVTALYAVARAAWPQGETDEDARARPLRALALVGGGLAAGTLLMAFMLIPEARSSHDTVGVLARKGENLAGQRIPLDALQTVVFPDRWGRPSAVENVADAAHNPFGVVNYNERTFYPGAVALLLACVGLLARGAWARKGPLALLAVVGLAVPLHAPGLYWAATHLPVLELVEPQRIHFAFELAVALLAAFGLQAVLDRPRGERRRLAVPLAALLAGAFALLTAGATSADAGDTLRHFLTGADSASSGVLALTSIVWFVLFALAVGVALLVVRQRPGWRLGVAAVVVVLAAADALHFAHGYQPMVQEAKAMPPATPAIAYLRRHRADGRVMGIEGALAPDSGLLYDLRDVRGYDPPQPTRRLLALWLLANPLQQSWTPLELPLSQFDAQALRVLSVLGARYLVLEPGFRLARRSRDALTTVYSGPDATILENARAAPRALVPSRVVTVANGTEAGRRIVERRFDSRTTVALERDDAAIAAPVGRGSAAVVDDRNASVMLRARLERAGLVVLGDALMDGWSVEIDGRPAAALRVNDVMRGVVVPAGSHEVVWSYAVPGLRVGALLSLLTAVALTGCAGTLLLRARRRERAAVR
jgi:hypothetical protein